MSFFFSYSEPEYLDQNRGVENGNVQEDQQENPTQENASATATTTTVAESESLDDVTSQDEVTDPLMLIQVGHVESNYAGFNQDETSWTENHQDLLNIDSLENQNDIWTRNSREQESADHPEENLENQIEAWTENHQAMENVDDHENQTEAWIENQNLDPEHEVGDLPVGDALLENPNPDLEQDVSEGASLDHENQTEFWSDSMNNEDNMDQVNDTSFENSSKNYFNEISQQENGNSDGVCEREENTE